MKRPAPPALGAAVVPALVATPALANHTHVLQVGNGRCVVLAANGGEDEVELPLSVFEHNPNVDVPSTGAAHPLHALVHKGVPGDHGSYSVFGSATRNAMCAAGYVNR